MHQRDQPHDLSDAPLSADRRLHRPLSEVEPSSRRIPDEGPWRSALDDYMRRRLAGRVDQHDVLTAYAPDKIVLARAELERMYALPPGRPLVILMRTSSPTRHMPTAGGLFQDSYDWFRQSLQLLRRNGRRQSSVKQHPSAALYGEAGLVERIMAADHCGICSCGTTCTPRPFFAPPTTS
jgi:hypothetical protein